MRDGFGYLEKERNIVPSEESVPTETFFLIRETDNKIVGMMNIRLALNEKVRNSYGTIGYGIRPSERRKGYNKINLYLGLLECQKRGMKKVMLSCDKGNLGSAKTIQHFNGVLENEYIGKDNNSTMQVYWIDVDSAIESKKDEFSLFVERCPTKGTERVV